MSKIEMFRSILEYIPEECGDLREEINAEIAKLSRAAAPNPTTVAAANSVRNTLDHMGTASKKELQEVTDYSHQRIAAACNLLEREGYLTVHPKGEGGKNFVWYSRN